MSRGDRAIRYGLYGCLAVVTSIAVAISYGHAYALAIASGETGVAAAVYPATVDGLIFTCSLVIVSAARDRRRAPVLAWFLLFLGIAATLAANISHGLSHGWSGALVAAWPAIVATGTFDLVIKQIRTGREVSSDVKADIATQVIATGVLEPTNGTATHADLHESADSPDPLIASARERFEELLATGKEPSIRAIRRELGIGHPRAKSVLAALQESAA